MGGKKRVQLSECVKSEPTVLVLRQCDNQLRGYNGFQYPESGMVEAPDWDPTPRCGGGLHGFLRGEGNGALADKGEDGKWLVLRVRKSDIVPVGDEKVKFPRGEVIYVGTCDGAGELLAKEYPTACIIGAARSVGAHQGV